MKTYSITTTGGLCLFSLEHAYSSKASSAKLQGYWADLQLFLQAPQVPHTCRGKKGGFRAASIAAWELRAKLHTVLKRAEHA